MRKHVLKVGIVAGALALFVAIGASPARGQTPPAQPVPYEPFGGRVHVNLSGAFQASAGGDIERAATFTLYEEQAQFQSVQDSGTGFLLDLGAGYRFGNRLGAGVAYTRTRGDGDATLSGSLPHPLFFNQPRTFSIDVTGLDRTEHAVHLQAVWWVPFTEQVDFAISGGPTIFTVQQTLARGVAFSEVPPQFTSVVIDGVDIGDPQRTGVGFNIGIDGSYLFRQPFFGMRLGAGAVLRYSRGTVDFNVTETEQLSVTAGGFQIGAGLRLRF